MLDEMTFSEAAARLNMKEFTFRRLCASGNGPKARRDGRTLRFLPKHLEEWAEQYKNRAYTDIGAKRKTQVKAKNPLD